MTEEMVKPQIQLPVEIVDQFKDYWSAKNTNEALYLILNQWGQDHIKGFIPYTPDKGKGNRRVPKFLHKEILRRYRDSSRDNRRHGIVKDILAWLDVEHDIQVSEYTIYKLNSEYPEGFEKE